MLMASISLVAVVPISTAMRRKRYQISGSNLTPVWRPWIPMRRGFIHLCGLLGIRNYP
jgi:hypothetical protein